ncbi:uncharacterized protein LOC126886858 [Diabrotica virgifera virgifera]|uniref:HTH CENPB-type domain-containing protein n=1 Tax=Diabrotica virgifera virgifera TaxID=50390 RepID=A0ABM5KI74_DIAVI|nr:uncharacterized protein LOC126886858 [Diabrotica virgifera virgifera]
MVYKKRMKYPRENIQKAIEDINLKRLSIRQASKIYNVPKSTLLDTMKEKYKTPGNIGGPTVLSSSEEDLIIKWIIEMGNVGFPVTRSQLVDSVSKLIQNLKRKTPFKNYIPGKKWYNGFLAHHPEISKRVPQSLSSCRAAVTEQNIRNWFTQVRDYMTKMNFLHILENPKRIFNCDESGFYLSPQEKQVLVRKGAKKVYSRIANDEKECLTVLLTVGADGSVPPPLVLYPYKRYVSAAIITNMPNQWGVGHSESGWMTSETFYEYVTNVFFPWLEKNSVPLPVILFLDGHSSHINLPITEFCKEKGIILTAFYPNATHRLQPLDVGVFYPIKNNWRKDVRSWRMENNGRKLQRAEFAKLLDKTLKATVCTSIIKSAFESCGLFPFNENRIDYSKLIKPIEQKDSDDKITESTSTTTVNVYDSKLLREVEIRLKPEVVNRFRIAESAAQLEEKYVALYDFWKSLHPQNVDHDKTLKNNLPINAANETIVDIHFDENFWFCNNDTIEATVKADGALVLIPSQNSNSSSPKPGPSASKNNDCENIDYYLAVSSPQEKTPPKNKIVNTTPCNSPLKDDSIGIVYSDQKRQVQNQEKTPLKQITTTSENNSKYPTPFKKALFWPESSAKKKNNSTEDTKERKKPKIYPTVAISDEFMEHQRRLKKEKEEKENEKCERIRKRKAKTEIQQAKKKKCPPKHTPGIDTGNNNTENINKKNIEIYSKDDFVLVQYDSEYFPGVVLERSNDTLRVKSMTMNGKYWKWPDRDDILNYDFDDVVCKIARPSLINKRGAYEVPEIENLKK